MVGKYWYLNTRIYGNGILGGNNIPMGAVGNYNSNSRYGLMPNIVPYNNLSEYFFEQQQSASGVFGQVAISGAWKTVSEVYVVVGGQWKSVTEIQTIAGGTWHTLTT